MILSLISFLLNLLTDALLRIHSMTSILTIYILTVLSINGESVKNWEKYRQYLESGDFHLHTNYTHGENTVKEMCEQAILNNLKLVAFTEHVRREISYDYNAFLSDIEEARRLYPAIKILSGCEAAVRDTEGRIDVSSEILDKAEIVVASFHNFPYGRKEDFLSAVHGLIKNPRVDIWAHPVTFLRNVDLTQDELEDIVRACIKNSVLIEDSLSPIYRAPEFISMAKRLGATIVRNSDAHDIYSMKRL